MTPIEQRMIPVYVLLIRNNLRTIDEVPEAIREAVAAQLAE